MFSAVALVAFSFSGMANTIEVEEVEVNNNVSNIVVLKEIIDSNEILLKSKKLKPLSECTGLLIGIYMSLKLVLPKEEAWDNALAYYKNCLEN